MEGSSDEAKNTTLIKQLLEDEREFKRKLYYLQLQAAVKDVEIKEEVLRQLKGGDLTFQNFLGMPKND